MLEGAPTSRFYIAVWMLALAGVVLTPWMRPVSLPLALVPFALAASHFVATVLIMPQVYVDRAIFPFYLLLVPYAAIPLAMLARWGTAAFPRHPAALLCIALFIVAVLRIRGWFLAVDFDVLTVALLTAGVCLAGLPTARPWTLTIYSLYAIALAIGLLRSSSGEAAAILRAGMLFIATALTTGYFLRDADGVRSALGWTILVLAAVGSAVLLAPGIPTGVVDQFAQSLRNAFGYLSSYSAAAGFILLAGAALVRARAPRVHHALLYAAAAALILPALHWAGAMITPQRALLQREVAVIGALGVAAYSAIWIHAAWPGGRGALARACAGLALGTFVTLLFGTVIGHAGAAPTVAAGLLIGLVQAERSAAQAARTRSPYRCP
jgi:hypothetical protein